MREDYSERPQSGSKDSLGFPEFHQGSSLSYSFHQVTSLNRYNHRVKGVNFPVNQIHQQGPQKGGLQPTGEALLEVSDAIPFLACVWWKLASC